MQQIVSINPNYADGYMHIGEILTYAGRPEEAIAYVEHATRINPQRPASYSYVPGHALLVMGQYRDAASALEEALKGQPDSVSARRMLIAAYGQTNEIAAARQVLAELRAAGATPGLKALRQSMPYRDIAMRDRVLDGLRAAGVPD